MSLLIYAKGVFNLHTFYKYILNKVSFIRNLFSIKFGQTFLLTSNYIPYVVIIFNSLLLILDLEYSFSKIF